MSPTVRELQNSIRVATGRFEREIKASFTKEELQAICEVLRTNVDKTEQPSTSRMRRSIRAHVGIAESIEAANDSTFLKSDLQVIADEVGASLE